jgi:dihydroflavonol-4-reductase
MIAFVTGASGFIGTNLVAELAGQGWDVVALHRSDSELNYLKRFPVHLAEGSIDDPAALARVIPQNVDAVFHLAADVSFWSYNNARQTRTNVFGTRNVVSAALARGARRLVHTSTSSVYGLIGGAFDETAPKLGRDSWFNYVATKTLAEDEVHRGIGRGLDAVIVNPTHIIGRYDRNNWARLIILAAKNKLPRIPPGRGSFCHGAEVARAHVAAFAKGRTGENYLLAGADASFQEVVATAGEILGRRIESRTTSARLLRFAGHSLAFVSHFTGKEPLVTPESALMLNVDQVFRSEKAERELGYRPASLSKMVDDCCRWLIEEGLLRRGAA